jgi:hypothetical protein
MATEGSKLDMECGSWFVVSVIFWRRLRNYQNIIPFVA